MKLFYRFWATAGIGLRSQSITFTAMLCAVWLWLANGSGVLHRSDNLQFRCVQLGSNMAVNWWCGWINISESLNVSFQLAFTPLITWQHIVPEMKTVIQTLQRMEIGRSTEREHTYTHEIPSCPVCFSFSAASRLSPFWSCCLCRDPISPSSTRRTHYCKQRTKWQQ